MTASINLPGVPVSSFAGQSYSEHQRNDWDASAFARLFDQTDGSSGSPVGEGKDTSECDQNPITAEPSIDGNRSILGVLAPYARANLEVDAGSPDQRMAALDDASSNSGIEAGGAGALADIPSVRGISGVRGAFESGKASEVAAIPASIPSDMTPVEIVVIAGTDSEMIHVSIRDARVKAWQLPQLLSKIRAELAWHGMAVGAISINGGNVYQAPDMNASGALNNRLQRA